MRVKICGITQPEQGSAIASLGATALGFICVPESPRYIVPDRIRAIVEHLPRSSTDQPLVDRVGVFADACLEEIERTVAIAHLSAVQLHGSESAEFCRQLKQTMPHIEVIKALRIRDAAALTQTHLYLEQVDALLLDAYHPNLLGGTGKTLDWSALHQFRPGCPWFLAGGLSPDNIVEALTQVQPDGIDLSSSLENAPGDKNLDRVAQLFAQLKQLAPIC